MTHLDPLLPALLVLLLAVSARLGRRPLALSIALFAWCWPPTASLAAWTLERSAPGARTDLDGVEALVVLAGKAYRPRMPDGSQLAGEPGDNTFLRCRRAAGLWRDGFRGQIVVSGGASPAGVVADLMAGLLADAGVPDSAILRERSATDTRDSAVNAARLLAGRGVHSLAVVTDAGHLPRAVGAFRKVGLDAIPVASDCYSCNFDGRWVQWLPSGAAAEANRHTLHEWLGSIYYRMRGWI